MNWAYLYWLGRPWQHCKAILWPVSLFKADVLAVLRRDREYFAALSEALHGEPPALSTAFLNLRRELALPSGHYPEWVFAPGFHATFRAGFRYFLLEMDRLHDLIIASHQLFLHKIEPEVVRAITPWAQPVVRHHLALVDVMILFFETGDWAAVTPHEDDMTSLAASVETEYRWHRVVPMWVRQQSDIRDALLQLVMTLPTHQGKEE